MHQAYALLTFYLLPCDGLKSIAIKFNRGYASFHINRKQSNPTKYYLTQCISL